MMDDIPTYTSELLSENQKDDLQPDKSKSYLGVFMLLINTTIGSGTLLIPYCYTSGLALVLPVGLFLAFVAYWSLHILVDAWKASGCNDYPTLFGATFGKKWMPIMHVWIVLVLFGTVIIYMVWIGRLMLHLVNAKGGVFASGIFWKFIFAGVAVFPLTIFKKLDLLQSWSGLAVVFILVLIAHAIYWFAKGVIEQGFDKSRIVYFHPGKELISTFSVNAMAYDCHCNVFGALEILPRTGIKNCRLMLACVVAASFLLYNAFGLFTYLHLFDELGPGSALEYYDATNVFTALTTAGVVLILVLGGPMMVWPTRNCVIGLIYGWGKDVSWFIWILIGAIITFGATGFACISSNVVFFFDLVGGLLTPGFVYGLPAVFYLKLVPNKKWWEILLTVIVMIVALGATIVCTYQVIKG